MSLEIDLMLKLFPSVGLEQIRAEQRVRRLIQQWEIPVFHFFAFGFGLASE